MKQPWKSKTLWFNALAGIFAAVEFNIHVLQPILGEQAYAILMMAVIIGNAALRVITTEGIALRGEA